MKGERGNILEWRRKLDSFWRGKETIMERLRNRLCSGKEKQ
jgi:hypothetical protein